jgi:mRNA interferase MazF
VVWLSFDAQAGHEQAGRRPAFILSPESYNRRTGLCLACPVTSQVKDYPFEVALPNGLDVGGVILADQVKSLDWRARRATFALRAPPAVTREVVSLVLALVDDRSWRA